MDQSRKGYSTKQSVRRDRSRPQKIVREDQPNRESSSNPPFEDEMKEIQELVGPPTQEYRPSISDWVGVIIQAVVATVGPSASFHSKRLEFQETIYPV